MRSLHEARRKMTTLTLKKGYIIIIFKETILRIRIVRQDFPDRIGFFRTTKHS